jgi:hypothetical protein
MNTWFVFGPAKLPLDFIFPCGFLELILPFPIRQFLAVELYPVLKKAFTLILLTTDSFSGNVTFLLSFFQISKDRRLSEDHI